MTANPGQWAMDRRTFLRGDGRRHRPAVAGGDGRHQHLLQQGGRVGGRRDPGPDGVHLLGHGHEPVHGHPRPNRPRLRPAGFGQAAGAVPQGDDLLHRPARGHRRPFVVALLPHRRRSAQGKVRHLLRPADRGAPGGEDPLPVAGPELHPANGLRRTGRRHPVLDAEPHAGRPGGSAASRVRPAVPAR